MTETEWLSATDPTPMLRCLRGKASNRKLRLLACGCCRQVEVALAQRELLSAISTAERYEEGQARYGEMVQAAKAVTFFSHSASGAEAILADGVWYLVTMGLGWNLWPAWRTKLTIRALLEVEPRLGNRLAHICRCVFGNPFRPLVLDPSWLTSHVLALTEGLHAARAFDCMPILADALQDAGCDNEDVLNHCRQPGEHVRGCWVVDFLLGKR